MRHAGQWWFVAVIGCVISLAASPAMGQPPPANQPPPGDQPPPGGPSPPPEQGPPAPAPEPNWAPPLPAETTEPEKQAPAQPSEGSGPVIPGTEGNEPSETPPEQIKESSEESKLEVYGHAMLDIGYDFGKIGDPDWEDVERPTKLPAFNDQFGKGPRTFAGVRQSRFGVDATTATAAGEIHTVFEFELFGVGEQAGQTIFRLRHAYGEWKGLRAGQTWSPFMDPDVFPDSIEYWGPNGMVFFRNAQLAYSPYKKGDSDVTIALERPGASADTSTIGERIDLENVVPRFPAPDVSADGKWAWSWGYLRLAGILRYMRWDDLADTPVVQGHAWGWGANLSSNLRLGPALLKLQAVYGHAIENYMNDAGFDVGPSPSGDPDQPIDGEALPVLGLVGFVDVAWNDHFSSTAGYSFVWVDNSEGQGADAFHIGHYALANILFHPAKSLFLGPEFQYGRRENNSDGFSANDFRLQFSVKFSFSRTMGGE